MSHHTHPIGINQARGLIPTQTCQGNGQGGGVAGDKKERLLLFRKERRVSRLLPRHGVASVLGVGLLHFPHLGKTPLQVCLEEPNLESSAWPPFIVNGSIEGNIWKCNSAHLKQKQFFSVYCIWDTWHKCFFSGQKEPPFFFFYLWFRPRDFEVAHFCFKRESRQNPQIKIQNPNCYAAPNFLLNFLSQNFCCFLPLRNATLDTSLSSPLSFFRIKVQQNLYG